MSIAAYLTEEHRACDELLAAYEEEVTRGDWLTIASSWQALVFALLAHFATEEEHLFPAFEEKTGLAAGPTRVMRMEHDQMRELFTAGNEALAQRDAETLTSLLETLLIMNQQHNLKEENVLYPLCDQVLGPEFANCLERP